MNFASELTASWLSHIYPIYLYRLPKRVNYRLLTSQQFTNQTVQVNYVQANYVQANYVQANYVQANYVQANYVQANCVKGRCNWRNLFLREHSDDELRHHYKYNYMALANKELRSRDCM